MLVVVPFIERRCSFSSQFERVFGFFLGLVRPKALRVRTTIERLDPLMFEAVIPRHGLFLPFRET